MDYKDIEALLEKYWACESSLEEEKALHDYFQGSDIPDHLLPYASLFRYYRNLADKSVPSGFDVRIINKINKKEVLPKERGYFTVLYKVAAAVLLALSFIFIHERYIRIKEEAISYAKDTFENPQAALEETRKVLLLVSTKMNKGTENLAKVNEFNKLEKILENSKTQ